MAPSIWNIMKRSTSNGEPQSKLQKMAPGLVNDTESRSAGSSLEVTSQFSYNKNSDYGSDLSDVLVVGAGPAGLMLA
jgi:phenol 2-monooxygenase